MTPDLSVIVSTRDRPADIVGCVRSILAIADDGFELVVVDQSRPDSHRQAVGAVPADPRLRWVPTDTRGLSVSRNVGVAAARAPIVVFTDDDCRVPADWLSGIRQAFATDKDLALLFGRVVLSAEDRARGYAAEFDPPVDREFSHAPDARVTWGVGANMAVRRAVFDRVGVFDPLLGAGARFRAAEEIDLTLRVLGQRMKVKHTRQVELVHVGVREGADASRIMWSYGEGLGAALAKHVRMGTPGAARLLIHWSLLQGRRAVAATLRGHRKSGFGLLAAVWLGVSRSVRVRVNRAGGLFQPR
jgi:GT2 family glycosyltransferase